MDESTRELLFALLGAVLGAFTALAWRISEHRLHGPPSAVPPEAPVIPPGVSTVLAVLRSSALVLDGEDQVLQASAPAYRLGLVQEGRLRVTEVLELVHQVRRDGEIRQAEITVSHGLTPVHVLARVAPLGSGLVLVLADDRTRERRVEAVRRDFVANVSHELKTPIGALTLLAEAVSAAADDPEAVRRFAGRMGDEADRLHLLVQQIIELSRLQGDEAVAHPEAVDVDEVVHQVVEAHCTEASAKGIALVVQGQSGHRLTGDREQVRLALSNLVSNAIAYSGDGGRVAVAAYPEGQMLDLVVADQGIGIPADEIDRIFERFYRVDPARHRSTGGTGLGLSIVKHVAASHGGEVLVWSAPGQGSTFTLRLPRALHDPAVATTTA